MIEFLNPSKFQRKQWVTWTSKAANVKSVIGPGGDVFPTVKGSNLSKNINKYHTLVTCDGTTKLQCNTSTLVEDIDFEVHPYLTGIEQTSIVICVDGQEHRASLLELAAIGMLKIVEQNAAVHVFEIKARVPKSMLIVEMYLYVYSNQAVVPFELQITNSDPSSRELNQPVEYITMSSPFVIVAPTLKSRGGEGSTNHITIAREVTIGDAQAVIAYGDLLCAPIGGTSEWFREQPKAKLDLLQTANSLLAAQEWPMLGFDTDWSKCWGPNDCNITIPNDLRGDVENRLITYYLGRLNTTGNIWDSLPYGQAKVPDDTGDQHGFGMFKLAQVFDSLSFLELAKYSTIYSGACRPIHRRELDGSIVKSKNHPNWVTWNEDTHYDHVVSPDRLGKGDGLHNRHDWAGRDKQHHSPLVEIGYYALSGSYLVKNHIRDMSEKLLATLTLPSEKPGWSTNSMGTARAIGRVLRSVSWLDWATDKDELLVRAGKRLRECALIQWAGKYSQGPVKVLTVYTDDPRGPSGAKRFWRPVFEATAVAGLLTYWQRSKDEMSYDLAKVIMQSLIDHGLQWKDGRYTVPWGVVYKNGRALDEVDWSNPNLIQWGGGAWEHWSTPAYVLGAKLFPTKLAEQCLTVFKDFEKNFGTTKDPDDLWRWVEWSQL